MARHLDVPRGVVRQLFSFSTIFKAGRKFPISLGNGRTIQYQIGIIIAQMGLCSTSFLNAMIITGRICSADPVSELPLFFRRCRLQDPRGKRRL